MAERPVVVVLVAPAGCGKTSFIAALQHLAKRGGAAEIEIPVLRGHGPTGIHAEQATRHLYEVYASLRAGGSSVPTCGWHTYRVILEQQGADSRSQREVFLLDVEGSSLFPSPDSELEQVRSGDVLGGVPPLVRRLQQLGLQDAPISLLLFANEPAPGDAGWRMPRHVPESLRAWLTDVRVSRIALFVACADLLFPRAGDLGEAIKANNAMATSPRGLSTYLSAFEGSRPHEFTSSFVRYLARSGLAGLRGAGSELAVFWGSAFGSLPGGCANVRPDVHPAVLADSEQWTPINVVEPLAWAAGLSSRTRQET